MESYLCPCLRPKVEDDDIEMVPFPSPPEENMVVSEPIRDPFFPTGLLVGAITLALGDVAGELDAMNVELDDEDDCVIDEDDVLAPAKLQEVQYQNLIGDTFTLNDFKEIEAVVDSMVDKVEARVKDEKLMEIANGFVDTFISDSLTRHRDRSDVLDKLLRRRDSQFKLGCL